MKWPGPARALSAQLAWIISLLIVAGLALAGTVTTWRLHSVLVAQIDRQLSLTMRGLDLARINPNTSVLGPTNYAMLFFDSEGQVQGSWLGVSEEQSTAPSIPRPQLLNNSGPFTVAGDGEGQWRVLTTELRRGRDGSLAGVVALALPLDSVNRTTRSMILLFAWVTLAVAAIATVVGRSMVKRSLKPLQGVERAAAAIADGDLSTRVPNARPGTEVGSLTTSLNTMLSHIEAAFAAQQASEAKMRRFVADASHELRTPLAAVRGYAELYRLGALPDVQEQADAIKRIEDEATRMGVLVGDLLSLTRLDEGRPLDLQPVDLHALAADALQDAHALAPDRKVTLNPATGSGPLVSADQALLYRVVANLVANAINHTPAGSPIAIGVGTSLAETGAPAGQWAVLEVQDHGPGIPDQVKGQVFERFFRLDSSRSRGSGGSGLGLAIVSSVVNSHGGQVIVSDTPGGGATMRVFLPLGPPPAVDDPA